MLLDILILFSETDMDLDQQEMQAWVEFVNTLDRMQSGALVGLLQMDGRLFPGSIEVGTLVGENKCNHGGQFISKHFPEILSTFCAWKKTSSGHLTTDGLLTFVPALAAAGVSPGAGAAAGLLSFLLRFKFDKWCSAYGMIELGGIGNYSVHAKETDMGGGELVGQRRGYFSLSIKPSVVEKSLKDRRYPDHRHVFRVRYNGSASAIYTPDDPKFIETVLNHAHPSAVQEFSFDDASGKSVQGVCSDLEKGPWRHESNSILTNVDQSAIRIDGESLRANRLA